MMWIIVYLIIDIIWIKLNGKMYRKNIEKIQKEKMEVKIIPSIIAYALMIINIIYVLKPNLKREIEYGIVGLVIYGVYNATNKATLKEYKTEVMIKDTLWGFVSHYIIGYYMLPIRK